MKHALCVFWRYVLLVNKNIHLQHSERDDACFGLNTFSFSVLGAKSLKGTAIAYQWNDLYSAQMKGGKKCHQRSIIT